MIRSEAHTKKEPKQHISCLKGEAHSRRDYVCGSFKIYFAGCPAKWKCEKFSRTTWNYLRLMTSLVNNFSRLLSLRPSTEEGKEIGGAEKRKTKNIQTHTHATKSTLFLLLFGQTDNQYSRNEAAAWISGLVNYEFDSHTRSVRTSLSNSNFDVKPKPRPDKCSKFTSALSWL